MNLADIHLMYEYNYWANARILDHSEQVTPEQYMAPSTHSFGSLHATLIHTLDTEYGWRTLLQSSVFSTDMTADDLPTLAAVRARWREEEVAMRAYIGSLSDTDLTSIIRYEVDGGAIVRERLIWHCLYHVVNHGMQHRAECAHLLTSYGHSPGEIDFTIFLNKRAKAGS